MNKDIAPCKVCTESLACDSCYKDHFEHDLHVFHREEKSLPHVAVVAIFLDDNKTKIDLKSKFVLVQTSAILFNFI